MNRPGLDTIDLAVLPESVLPVRVPEAYFAQHAATEPFQRMVQEHPKLNILVGYNQRRDYPPILPGQEPPTPSARCYDQLCLDVWNAASIIGRELPFAAHQKGRLVPFAERIPYLETVGILKDYNLDLGGGFGNYAFPDSLHTLRTSGGVEVGVAICYESIFPGYLTEMLRPGGEVLAVITNDGWYRNTSGYQQHAAFARLRAIENRRWVVRSANTGISSVITATGREVMHLGWQEQGILDAEVPRLTELTFYTRYGDWLGRLATLVAFSVGAWLLVARIVKRAS